MSSDPPEKTDPGLRQNNQTIGANNELTLPDVVPLIDPSHSHTSRVGLFANEVWIRNHWFWRGVFGTLAEWFTFFVGAAAQYPKVSVVGLAMFSIIYEEKYSENPVMTNTIKYAMTAYDPEAAEKIFAPKIVKADPIGEASRALLTDVTTAYLRSPEYEQLKAETTLDVQRQIRRETYLAAGMLDDAAAVDAEIVAARAERVRHAAPTSASVNSSRPEVPATSADVQHTAEAPTPIQPEN